MRRRGKGTDLRNQTFKSDARTLAHKALASSPEMEASGIDANLVRFEPVTNHAIDASYQWEEAGSYPWECIQEWKRKDAKGFDLALWYGQELCGLCYATPRKSVIQIKVVLLQGKPDRTHPLRGLVAPLSLLATDFYARMLRCTEIEIQDPDAGAIRYYLALGFTFDAAGRLVISVGAP